MEVNRKKNIAIVVMAVLLSTSLGILFIVSGELDRARSVLTAKDAAIQLLNVELGISQSSLVDLSELNSKYKSEINGFPDKLRQIIDSYELKIQSRDHTIASLRNTIRGGTTEVVVTVPDNGAGSGPPSQNNQIISYKWTDTYNRFHLIDPDIFVQDNEEFSYNQYVSIKGYVLFGKDGKLQIRRVELHEVIPNGRDASGNMIFKDVPGSKMELVDSTFEYADLNSNERSLWDVVHPRLIASIGAQASVLPPKIEARPGVGVEVINLGRYIDYANLGLNLKVIPDFDNVLGGSILNTKIGAGLNYTIAPPIIDTNFGIGAGVATPSNNLLNEWYFTVDAIFYITN